jgi:hypothetical protein
MSSYPQILADISSGNTGFADIMFLVGFILFLLAAILFYPRPENKPPYGHVVLALGLAAISLGWLVL